MFSGLDMYIRVSVTAGAKRETFEVMSENRFKISVKERAQHNLANKRVLELIARHFTVPVERVRIINGHQRDHQNY
jgi:uncharacterized protein YggU (UPF0235/DUF167 family)